MPTTPLTRRHALRRLSWAAWGGILSAYANPSAAEPSAMRTRMISDIEAWDAIARHRTGTRGDALTAGWLAEEIRAAGLEPGLHWFPFRRRVLHDCRVSVGSQAADGVPLFDGAWTGAGGWRAPLRPLEDDAGIGVTRFSPMGGAGTTTALQAARRRHRHAAIVAVSSAEDIEPGLALLNADAYGEPFGPPVLQVATGHGDWLREAAAEGALAHFVAHVTLEDTRAANVQATVPGRDPRLPPLVVMTPRSAWWTCTAERAGGIAVWLAALRSLAGQPPARTVIFTANTGHELGHIGLDRYLAREKALIRGAHAWVHLGANFAARGSELLFQASSEALLAGGLQALADVGEKPAHIMPVGTRPLGEARDIFDGGGRYVSILGSNRWFHHPDDRWPDSVDVERTARLSQAMLAVVRNLAGT